MTGICHCPQSYYSEEKDLTFRSVSLTPTITTISWRLSIILSKTLLRNWVFQINGILHWQSKWKGRLGQCKIRSVNSLAHLCLWMECLKSEHFPYSCILCQNNIHSHYCMLQAPASSIPYFVLLRGRWCLNFIIVMPIFIWKKVFLYYSLCKGIYISVVLACGMFRWPKRNFIWFIAISEVLRGTWRKKARKLENTEIGSDSQQVMIVISLLLLSEVKSEDITQC